MSKREIDIVVGAKDKTQRGLAGAMKSLKKLGRTSLNVGKMIVRGIASAGAAIGGIGAYFVKAASDAEETTTKFDAVYSNIRKTAHAAAESLANDFRLASSTSKKLLSDTGDLLVGFGFEEKAALDLSDKVNRLAIDLASFTNYSGGAAGASQALTKLLLGETEQAKALGIVVRQGSDEYKAAVKAKMEDQGVSLLQAKALVALEMALEQTKKAHGDYERTQAGVANRAREVSERFKDMREKIGAIIIKSAGVANILTTVANKIGALTGRIVDLAADGAFERFAATVKFVMADTWENVKWFASAASIVLKNAAKIAKNQWENSTDAIGYLLAKTHAKMTGQEWNLQPPKMRDLMDGVEKIPEKNADALAKYQAALDAIDARGATAKAAAAAEEASNAVALAEEALQSETAALQAAVDQTAGKILSIEEKLAKKKKQLREKGLQEDIAALEELKAKREEVAKKTVQDIIDEAKAAKDAAKEQGKTTARGEKLAAMDKRGIKLSRKDREFLDAFNAIEEAKEGLNKEDPAMRQLMEAQERLKKLQNDGKTLGDILQELKDANTTNVETKDKLDTLLRLG